MAGNGAKVKMGAAWVFFGTIAGAIGQVLDLGYTKGGVGFSMETQTHEITVDQEGISAIADTILGRRVTVDCPLAESDYTRLHYLIPESDLSSDGTGTLLEIKSGVGSSLMAYADVLQIVSMQDPNDWIKLYKAAPIANIRSTFTADGERIWPVQFKGYVPESTSLYAGKLIGLHQGS